MYAPVCIACNRHVAGSLRRPRACQDDDCALADPAVAGPVPDPAAPAWVRLGAGPRFLLLKHIGRRIGLARYAVLEVIDRDRGEWYVVAAYGQHAQWYRNIRRQPEIRVWWLRLRAVPCEAIICDHIAARERFASYVERNPRLTTGAPPDLAGADLVDHLTREVPVVCLSTDRRAA